MKYESSIPNHSKAMANVKVFADKQTDRLFVCWDTMTPPQLTGYTPISVRKISFQFNLIILTICPPIYQRRDIKNKYTVYTLI